MQKNCYQHHFIAQSILDKRWKFQPGSSNGMPVRSYRTKAVVRTPTQLAVKRLHPARMATLMSIEYWSVLEVSIRCRAVLPDVQICQQMCGFWKYLIWFKMICNCHRIREEKLQKYCSQRHFIAQSILDKRWKFQPDSSNGTPVQSNRTKAVAQTPPQLAANRLRAAQTATLKSNEWWSILEVINRCTDSAQEVSQAYNAHVLCNNFWKFFVFYLSQNWTGVCVTAFAQLDHTSVLFELSGWHFQRLSRVDWDPIWC